MIFIERCGASRRLESIRGCVCTGLAVLALSSTVWSAELWVDRNSLGGPCDDGRAREQVTFTSPWCTLAGIGNRLQPGDVIRVREGEYTERFYCTGCWGSATLQVAISGTSMAPIRFIAEPGEAVVLSADGGAEWGILVVAGGGITPRFIQFDGFVVRGFSWKGVMVKQTSDVVLRNLEVTQCSEGAIGILQSSRVTVEGCRIHHNALTGWTSPLNFWECGPGNQIRGNRIWANTDEDPRETEGHGIIFDYCQNAAASPNIVENNIIWDNEGLCMNLFHSSGFIVRNNTCWMNNLGRSTGTVGEVWLGGNDMAVFNNILGSRGYGPAIFVTALVEDTSSITSDFNLLWSANLGNIAGWPPWSTGTLEAYRSHLGTLDVHTLQTEPLLADPVGSGFELHELSPAIDSGARDGMAGNDANGVPRPVDGDGDGAKVPDIGAYEFGSVFGDGFESGSATYWSQGS